MVLLDFPLQDPDARILCTDGLVLRYPQRQDYDAWAALRAESRNHLQPWEPAWGPEELSRDNYRRRLRLYARDIRNGQARPWFIFTHEGSLAGGCTLSQIHYRASRTAKLGYWIGAPFLRRGYAFAAVEAAIAHAFGTLGLERIEAACMIANAPSRNLLLKAGFEQEGMARGYLNINGRREDHYLFGLLKTDYTRL